MTELNEFFGKVVLTDRQQVMLLNIFVDSDDSMLKNMYAEAAANHNIKIMNDPQFYDAGFDLFLPKDDAHSGTKFFSCNINKVNFKVKCSAKIIFTNPLVNPVTQYINPYSSGYYTPYYTYARSSISKTPLRLANNQGIIDAGYRGSLIGMFDCYKCPNQNVECDYYVEPYTRLLQVCAPSLMPIYVRIVDTFEELGPETSRGAGGFGSTGK
jgi:dUTP pyrophosphatase